MRGPTPKNPAVRQRVNKAPTAANLIDQSPLALGCYPELPTRMDDEGCPIDWHPWVLDWWREIWESPMATEYTQADVQGLVMLMDLQDRYWRKPNTALAGEVRLQRQCYGLTSIDRRRLQWEIKRADAAEKPRRQERPDRAVDPRSVLKAV